MLSALVMTGCVSGLLPDQQGSPVLPGTGNPVLVPTPPAPDKKPGAATWMRDPGAQEKSFLDHMVGNPAWYVSVDEARLPTPVDAAVVKRAFGDAAADLGLALADDAASADLLVLAKVELETQSSQEHVYARPSLELLVQDHRAGLSLENAWEGRFQFSGIDVYDAAYRGLIQAFAQALPETFRQASAALLALWARGIPCTLILPPDVPEETRDRILLLMDADGRCFDCRVLASDTLETRVQWGFFGAGNELQDFANHMARIVGETTRAKVLGRIITFEE